MTPQEARSLLANKALFEIFEELERKAIQDWKGNPDSVVQHSLWQQVATINRVRDSVRRKCERIIRKSGISSSDTTNE